MQGGTLPFVYLIGLAFLIGAFQFMFLAYIETSRPRYGLVME